MNYSKAYETLCTSRQKMNRKKGNGIYYELHHIIPSCLGGSNDKENLVLLTGKEHFVAHLLLSEMHTVVEKCKMIYSLRYLIINDQIDYKVSARTYERLKIEWLKAYPKIRKTFSPSAETRAKISKTLTGRKNPLIAETARNRIFSPETRLKKSLSMKGKNTGKRGPISEKHREILRVRFKDRIFSDEHLRKIRETKAKNRAYKTNI